MKISLRLHLCLSIVLVSVPRITAAEETKAGIVRYAPAELKWHAVPDTPVTQADGWRGAGGAHCDFQKFPKGFTAPLHTHSADVSSVVVSGHFGSAAEGAAEKALGPGSYQSIPADFKHTTKCGADAECIVFVCQPGPFDLKPVQGASTPKK
jgi:hypothetical protein